MVVTCAWWGSSRAQFKLYWGPSLSQCSVVSGVIVCGVWQMSSYCTLGVVNWSVPKKHYGGVWREGMKVRIGEKNVRGSRVFVGGG